MSWAKPGEGIQAATATLASGGAWRKFQGICEAQGGMRVPPSAPHTRPVLAECAGIVSGFDNRRLAKAAKLAGAPRDTVAGIDLHTHVGARVERGQPLFTLHAAAIGELDYALAYLSNERSVVAVEQE